ncbi:phenylalanine--tRNA ligase subunit beta [bacterium]|nr:phenylalanine--tRNA ligase subunit beta [bacterium]
MRVPFCWLKDYVKVDESAQEVAELLQSVGVPVENIESVGAQISGVVTCKIEKAEKHPEADRLQICQVNTGKDNIQIVTAATNAREGLITAVSLHGAVLADGTKIKRTKFRGVPSEGMFCGCEEIGVDPEFFPEDKREGIVELDPSTPLGVEVQKVLPIVEDVFIIESFANRADQLSIIGVARELAAKVHRPLQMPKILEDFDNASINDEKEDLVTIEDYEACPRFMARLIKDVKVGPSPKWMARRLELAGMRSINNVVDITNYVMLETGQPLHAYNRWKLAGGRLIVRRAGEGEVITTLDGNEQKLPEGTIVIADPEKNVGVAGIMGGLDTEVEDDTAELLLESAAFASGDVRRASLRLGLRTESSSRFEKGLDIERVIFGSQRASYLLGELCGVVESKIVVKSIPNPDKESIVLRSNTLKRVLGVEIVLEKSASILRNLGFEVEILDSGDLKVQVPSFRIDIAEEIDLVEEIARHAGYDNLPNTLPDVTPGSVIFHSDAVEEKFRDMAVSLGLNEVITPSLFGLDTLEKFNIKDDVWQIINPLSEDQRVLRPYIFPSLIEVVNRNLRVRNEDLRLFELSHIYQKDGDKVKEPMRLGLVLSFVGATFFNLKGVIESMAQILGVNLTFQRTDLSWGHPGCSAQILLEGKKPIGWICVLHPVIAKELDIEQPLIFAELDIESMAKAQGVPQYKKISRYPSVERDLALVMAEDVQAGVVSARFKQIGGDLVSSVKCFDVYKGDSIEKGYKSMAFRFVLQSMDKTLTDDDISKFMKKIQKLAEREFQAKVRE